MFLTVGCRSSSTETVTNANNGAASANSNAPLSSASGEIPQNAANDSLAEVKAEDSIAGKPSKNNINAVNRTADPNSVKSAGGRITNGVPAPENSFVTTVMNEKGVPIETRVFQNHPVLAKVERTFFDANKTSTKVFLRSGKVLPMADGKIKDLAVAPAAQILDAVGIRPPTTADSSEKKEETDKQK